MALNDIPKAPMDKLLEDSIITPPNKFTKTSPGEVGGSLHGPVDKCLIRQKFFGCHKRNSYQVSRINVIAFKFLQ
jgi:hypothetical protein